MKTEMFTEESPQRHRAAAVIVRDNAVLMVRERGSNPATGRHDGQEYWTLPGGGIDPGESLEDAVRREVAEETGLKPLAAKYLYDFPYPSGRTSCFVVEVAPGEPMLGVDPELECDCPRMVGLDWIPLPEVEGDTGAYPIPTLIMASDF